MQRAYYHDSIYNFLNTSIDQIFGQLARSHNHDLESLQKNAWTKQIQILQSSFAKVASQIRKENQPQNFTQNWNNQHSFTEKQTNFTYREDNEFHIVFEYMIPRMGKRVDNIILYKGIVFVLEFKVGAKKFDNAAKDQALDYALDLKNFHEQSHDRYIIPIVIATEAQPVFNKVYDDKVHHPICINQNEIVQTILKISEQLPTIQDKIIPKNWLNSKYKPTPTIIEAAQALYRGHNVKEISRSDSGNVHLHETTRIISRIIDKSKKNKKKSICFITGVPGAGKTLAGLNLANTRHHFKEEEHAVFLSGNGPLVKVLQEALAIDDHKNNKVTKMNARSKTTAFIQNIHHFRDDALITNNNDNSNPTPPLEKVVIFDEAQRAWTEQKTTSFMRTKKGVADFNQSEPEFLISVLDRHQDWAVIICLIGGGQEINTGEAGLPEWFNALSTTFSHWDIYTSDVLTEEEYTQGTNLFQPWESSSSSLTGKLKIEKKLHLSVSVRSYRSEKLSQFIKESLDLDYIKSRESFRLLINTYPVILTRSLSVAKEWLKNKARGNETTGLIASSNGLRLKPYSIYVKNTIDPTNWFLKKKQDIRSSSFLEDVATEFDIQGLELDWTCVAWDANLRINGDCWQYKCFKGTDWQDVKKEEAQRYLINSYRVLLTRARQGMIIFIPEGDPNDRTRLPEFYDPIFNYFHKIGIPYIE